MFFVDDILHKAIGCRDFRETLGETIAIIVIAHAGPDWKWTATKGGFETPIAVGIALVGQVTGRKQQIRHRVHITQPLKHLIEAPSVELRRIIRIETQMNIGDLRNQHGWVLSLFAMHIPCFDPFIFSDPDVD